MKATKEKSVIKINGFVAFFLLLGLGALEAYYIYRLSFNFEQLTFLKVIILSFISLLGLICLGGFSTLQPNEAAVLTFFGKYIGTIRDAGFWWSNPLASKVRILLRVRNFDSKIIKVNDYHGNPIEIGAVIVWKVVDTVKAIFDVEDYERYVSLQSETAIRHIAIQYPYDSNDSKTELSLRGNTEKVCNDLKIELQSKLITAGIEIIETKLSHLAYAPEIAQAMLRRQQAEAIISARQKIVEGAVGMVKMALDQLSEHNIVELDDERKAIMVNNLLVTLVSESNTQPVINAGSIY